MYQSVSLRICVYVYLCVSVTACINQWSLQPCSDYPRVDITITQTDIMMTPLYHGPQTFGFCKRPASQLGALKTIARLANEPLGCPPKRIAWSQMMYVGHKSRKNAEQAIDQKSLSQAGHPNNEDNLVSVGLLPLVHPDHGQEPEGGRGGVHLCQLSTGDTQLRAGE